MPSRHRRRRTAAALGAAGAAAALALGGAPGTYAAFSDFGTVSASATAGDFQPNPSDACKIWHKVGPWWHRVWVDDLAPYQQVLYVDGSDSPVLFPRLSDIPRIIIVTGGSVVIQAGPLDCIMTGPAGSTTKVDIPWPLEILAQPKIVLGAGDATCAKYLLGNEWDERSCAHAPYKHLLTTAGISSLAGAPQTLLVAPTKDSDAPSPSGSKSPDKSGDSSTPADPKTDSSDEPTKSESASATATATPTPTPTPTPSATSSSPATPTNEPSTDTSSATGTATDTVTSTGAAPTESSEGGQS